MYALINHTSDNGKDIQFAVTYNDVMFELDTITIDGRMYDMCFQPESRALKLYYYMVSRINVWKAIRKFEKDTIDELFIDNNY